MIRSVFILISILLFGNVFGQVIIPTQTLKAKKATSGTGLFKESIWWIDWDTRTTEAEALPNHAKNFSRIFTSPTGYRYIIKIENVEIRARATTTFIPTTDANYILTPKRTNSYSLNNFPKGYNLNEAVGDEGNTTANSKLTGKYALAPNNGHYARFKLTVVGLDANNQEVTPKGIVIAGSESISSQNEFYRLTTKGVVRIIDKYVNSGLSADYNLSIKATKSADGSSTIEAIGKASQGDGKGDVVLFAEDTSEVIVEVQGGGGQHIALGFIEEVDYSDTADSPTNQYGQAWHSMDTAFNGAALNGNFEIAKISAQEENNLPTKNLYWSAKIPEKQMKYMFLGNNITADGTAKSETTAVRQLPTSNLRNIGDEDDGVPDVFNKVNQSFPLSYTNSTSSIGHINIWLDSNQNGQYDISENYTYLVNQLINTPDASLTPEKILLKNKHLNYLRNITGEDCNSAFSNYSTQYRLTACPNTINQFYNIDLKIYDLISTKSYEMRVRLSSVENLAASGYAPDGEVEDHYITILAIPNDITGTVFLDDNANIPDGVPLKDINVTLRNITLNTIVETKKTATDGSFLFAQIPSANYEVSIESPSGKHHVSSTDITPKDGKTDVTIGTTNVGNIDFGVYDEVCHKPARMDASINNTTKHGITS